MFKVLYSGIFDFPVWKKNIKEFLHLQTIFDRMISGSQQVILRSAYTHTNSYPADTNFVLSVQKGIKHFSRTHFNHTDYAKYVETYLEAASQWRVYKYRLATCLHVKGKFNTIKIHRKILKYT